MPTVLVVDDSDVDRGRVGGLLRTSPALHVEFAGDGAEALRRIADSPPDLVLTDLMMPEMDGLELVAQIVSRYPLIPVILMTGRGNEQTAVKALEGGAASYVPKRLLATLLVETVHRVLEAANEVRSEIRLMDCLTRSEAFFTLNNDAAMISPLVNYVHRNMRAIGLCDEAGTIRVCVALEEAINNAMFHGNLEISSDARVGDGSRYRQLVADRTGSPPYRDRTIQVEARITKREAVFIVRDEGPGFDPQALPDPTLPENLEKACGRGLLLMRTFMDSVVFNRAGNEVTMKKRHEPGRTAPE